MTGCTVHVDTFTRDNLPPADQQPEFRFELPELQYPERINCACALLDDAVSEGCGDRIALIGASEQLTYAQLQARVDRIAHVLVQRMGVVPGARILLRGYNSPMLGALWLAVIKAGGVVVTTMPMLRARELASIAAKAQIQHAICEAGLVEELRRAAQACGLPGRIVTYGDGELEAMIAQAPAPFTAAATARDDVCLLAFTSGTTGAPKATMHFHRDVLAMADIVGGRLLQTTPDDVYVGSPPLGFTFGLGALLVFPLRFRAAGVLLEQPRPEVLLDAVARWRGTCLFTAPTMYRTLAAQLGGRDLSSLRQCVSAGEHLPRATSDLWWERTRLRLIDGIGATEMIHIFISAKGEGIRPGATGKPLPGYTACVLDDQGRPAAPGEIGRLAVKGPTGCRYLADERQTQYVVNGWNVTGDLYRMDEDGYFWFVARADDMIISAGYNLSAVEIESALMEHPAVRECAVVASPDALRGQVAKAYIALNPSFAPGDELAAQLQEFVKTLIAPYKHPRRIEFIEQLPRTNTGKVQRNLLRERELAAAREQPQSAGGARSASG